ncbi:Cytochrome P450 CYP2 subfamily [Handroanthus impetiginosus]|uniref:Cytochrome P450 CYP2 subfamily n=1 Tax=Handroanthus impetiginosus TaxID=429701 RepID=A0A2G9HU76_9LAMI|nr:Cytochrome P450 CYP2 subfamily [Handroanthus impetiginosus]
MHFLVLTPTNLPPSPPSLPIIGHIHLLRQPIHSTLHELSHKYGHVISLRLGSRKVLVVSSPEAAKGCFTKNDIVFANRPEILAGKLLHYNCSTVGFAPYGGHWRDLRGLSALELFSPSSIALFSSVREEEVYLMLRQYCGKYANVKDEEARLFQCIIREVQELTVNSNMGDYFPLFKWFDIRGVQKKMTSLNKKMDKFFQDLIDEHRKAKNESKKKTLIGAMLLRQEIEHELHSTTRKYCFDDIIKGILFLTYLDTCSIFYFIIGIHEKCAEYFITKKLIGNTVHLTFCDYDVPRGTMLLVNLWTIQKDPKLWEESNKFMPERFSEKEFEGYKLMPFGAGRRACAQGLFFEWERVSTEEIDSVEGAGLTVSKVKSLEALCKPRKA